MKQLICEMCGSKDLIKQDGVFVCQSCGCKYSVEDARKMLVEVEGTVEVKGTVTVDSSERINNLILRAKEFEQNDDFDKAIEYYNMVLDIDANNSIAKSNVEKLNRVYIGSITVSQEDFKRIKSLIISGEKLEAIKIVQEISGLGLADSKIWVENYKSYDLRKAQEFKNSADSQNYIATYGKNATTNKSSGCYIATCVYGSYDCPQVWTLRRFRDYTLSSTWHGRAFIRFYYTASPTLVKWFGKAEWFKKMWRGFLDRMLSKLHADGVKDTPYQDKEW